MNDCKNRCELPYGDFFLSFKDENEIVSAHLPDWLNGIIGAEFKNSSLVYDPENIEIKNLIIEYGRLVFKQENTIMARSAGYDVRTKPAMCYEKVQLGHGRLYRSRFYYDSDTGECIKFMYRGGVSPGPLVNRFLDYSICKHTCA